MTLERAEWGFPVRGVHTHGEEWTAMGGGAVRRSGSEVALLRTGDLVGGIRLRGAVGRWVGEVQFGGG